ncbi:MAG: hypothetical protein ACK47B_15590 [Armatimonadota bacterium]
MNTSFSRIAIQVAVPQELAPLRRLLGATAGPEGLRRWSAAAAQVGDREVLLLASGMGARRAAECAAAVLDHWRPDLLLPAGVAGALSATLRIGDLVVADAVLSGEEWLRASLVPKLTSKGAHTRSGGLLSQDQVLIDASEKRAAAVEPLLAVEMETAAAARLAIEKGVAWAAVRAVSDTADESLPLDFNLLRDESGDLPTARVALAALRRPGSIPGLVRLGGNTSRAAAALAAALQGWLDAGCPARLAAPR